MWDTDSYESAVYYPPPLDAIFDFDSAFLFGKAEARQKRQRQNRRLLLVPLHHVPRMFHYDKIVTTDATTSGAITGR